MIVVCMFLLLELRALVGVFKLVSVPVEDEKKPFFLKNFIA